MQMQSQNLCIISIISCSKTCQLINSLARYVKVKVCTTPASSPQVRSRKLPNSGISTDSTSANTFNTWHLIHPPFLLTNKLISLITVISPANFQASVLAVLKKQTKTFGSHLSAGDTNPMLLPRWVHPLASDCFTRLVSTKEFYSSEYKGNNTLIFLSQVLVFIRNTLITYLSLFSFSFDYFFTYFRSCYNLKIKCLIDVTSCVNYLEHYTISLHYCTIALHDCIITLCALSASEVLLKIYNSPLILGLSPSHPSHSESTLSLIFVSIPQIYLVLHLPPKCWQLCPNPFPFEKRFSRFKYLKLINSYIFSHRGKPIHSPFQTTLSITHSNPQYKKKIHAIPEERISTEKKGLNVPPQRVLRASLNRLKKWYQLVVCNRLIRQGRRDKIRDGKHKTATHWFSSMEADSWDYLGGQEMNCLEEVRCHCKKKLAQLPGVDMQHGPAKLSSKVCIFRFFGTVNVQYVGLTTGASWEFLRVNCRQLSKFFVCVVEGFCRISLIDLLITELPSFPSIIISIQIITLDNFLSSKILIHHKFIQVSNNCFINCFNCLIFKILILFSKTQINKTIGSLSLFLLKDLVLSYMEMLVVVGFKCFSMCAVQLVCKFTPDCCRSLCVITAKETHSTACS
ncbi:hypothetical protein VP01_950g3 [Puccinia sorghi]|uniref:Uncharacterized protein n=1 Tax=Puccinia sorghi TaxID=27349 RepID=A0A0L6U6Y6_9BASI|nr:hypothetical protein VP01_950g3 [Puccinia sorghi]